MEPQIIEVSYGNSSAARRPCAMNFRSHANATTPSTRRPRSAPAEHQSGRRSGRRRGVGRPPRSSPGGRPETRKSHATRDHAGERAAAMKATMAANSNPCEAGAADAPRRSQARRPGIRHQGSHYKQPDGGGRPDGGGGEGLTARDMPTPPRAARCTGGHHDAMGPWRLSFMI